MTSELKPYPFCGGEQIMTEEQFHALERWILAAVILQVQPYTKEDTRKIYDKQRNEAKALLVKLPVADGAPTFV